MTNNAINDDDVKIGKRMRTARLEKGLTQKDLARIFKISGQQIQKFEFGMNRITAKMLCRLATLCDKPMDWFTQDIETKDIQPLEQMLSSAFTFQAFGYLRKIKDEHAQRKAISIIKLLSETEGNVTA